MKQMPLLIPGIGSISLQWLGLSQTLSTWKRRQTTSRWEDSWWFLASLLSRLNLRRRRPEIPHLVFEKTTETDLSELSPSDRLQFARSESFTSSHDHRLDCLRG
ncbi:hypothetical protein BDW62DRAFT_5208 [Aspergillus aurantiobrunneus]